MRALVLGNSRGIGLAITEALKKEGYDVPIISRTTGYDLMTDEGINKVFRDIDDIYVLIGNIGGMGTCDLKDFEEVMKKNYFINVKILLHYLTTLERNNGIVIFISSSSKHNPVFAAAKAAEEAFLKSLSTKYSNIRMNIVSPGHIDVGKHFPDNPKRIGKPEDVSNLVAFLCSSKANYISGANIVVNGGSL